MNERLKRRSVLKKKFNNAIQSMKTTSFSTTMMMTITMPSTGHSSHEKEKNDDCRIYYKLSGREIQRATSHRTTTVLFFKLCTKNNEICRVYRVVFIESKLETEEEDENEDKTRLCKSRPPTLVCVCMYVRVCLCV